MIYFFFFLVFVPLCWGSSVAASAANSGIPIMVAASRFTLKSSAVDMYMTISAMYTR